MQILTRDRALADALAQLVGDAGGRIWGASSNAVASVLFLDERLGSGSRIRPPRSQGPPTVVLISLQTTTATWRLAQDVNADQVVDWPDGADQLAAWCVGRWAQQPRAASQPKASAGSPGHVIAVTGSRGGCGATLLAAAIATASADTGAKTVLVDLDPHSVGFLPACGLPKDEGLQWHDFRSLREPANGARLLERLPQSAGVRVLGGDLIGGADNESVRHALTACQDTFETIVLDAPRYRKLPAQTRVQTSVYLSSTELVSLASLAQLMADCPAAQPRVVLRKDIGAVPLASATRFLRPHQPVVCGHVRGVRGSADFGALLASARNRRLRWLAEQVLAPVATGVDQRAK